MSAGVQIQVRLVASDSPSGRIAVRVIDQSTHQAVRPLEDGPVTYYSVREALCDCETAGLEVLP